MKNDIFRDITFWKSACITMPDNSFYELLRSVFGKIKTPFNKQQLLNYLETFLLREDIQKTIASYIDETDAKIIASVAVFNEPVPEQLERFFSSELSQAQLQDIIVNLEERFILYRFTENKVTCLALNPVLKHVLLPFTADTSALFPAAKDKKTHASSSAPKAKLNDLVLAALYSFVCGWDSFYRSEGVIRKRILEDGKKLFPGMDLADTLGSLQLLGLFYIDSNLLVPDKKYFNDFCSLSSQQRMEYIAAALIIYTSLTQPFEILPPIFRNKIREIVNFIHGFLESLEIDLKYSEKTLKRMAEVLKAQTGLHINTDSLLEALEITCLIADGAIVQSNLNGKNTNSQSKPVITIDSGSSVLMYPEINFADAVKLVSFLNICDTVPVSENTVVRLKLDRDSIIRAFDNNMSADEIIELLNGLGGGKINESLIWNLKEWEKRYGEISLKKGVILQLAEEHRYLINTKPFSALIRETPAAGVYLLNENAMDDAAEALQKAGIDIVSRRKEKKEPAFINSNHFLPPEPFTNIRGLSDTAAQQTKSQTRLYENSSAVKSKFLAVLEKMQLSESEKNELTARINRGLVLCETQLKEAVVRYEKLEARHMDYIGKQNIAKQAIAQQSPVEIVWTIKGKEKNIFGIPKVLEKDGGDLILVIDDNRIPLAKIGLLRRIKRSIFE